MWVYGSVKSRGGYSAIVDGHLDVLVLDRNGKLLRGVAISYFPEEIPPDLRGSIGGSKFSVTLPPIPASAALVRVVYHRVPEVVCQYSTAHRRDSSTARLEANASKLLRGLFSIVTND